MLKVLTLAVMVTVVQGYGKGPPDSVCDSMTPGHGTDPQTGASPYSLTLSSTTYSPNEQLTVTLDGATFKGFMIQARTSASSTTTFGTFASLADTSNPCSGQTSAVAHATKKSWTTLTLTWTAPSSDVGNIVFVFTVVQQRSTFWVKQTATALTYKAPTGNPATTQAPVTQPPTTQPAATGTIDRDTDCEVSKSCFPPQCTTNCDYLVSWKPVGNEDVEFTLKRKTSSNNFYIALGLSDDGKMTNDSVMLCVSYSGAVDVFNGYNPDYYNQLLSNPKFGLSSISGSLTDGILSCTFRRKKNAAMATTLSGAVSDGDKFFDLNTQWYMFVAHGLPANSDGAISKHISWPAISPSKINFLEIQTSIPTTPAADNSGTITKASGCGDSLGCYSDCEGDSCSFLFTWKDDNSDDLVMTLACKRPTNAYCAIGLSKDSKMGDDSVMQLVGTGGTAAVSLSYNSGSSNRPLDDSTFGLTVTSSSYENGVLRTSFTRKKTYAQATAAQGRRKRAAASPSNFFDMNSDYTLLYAYGFSAGGSIQKHSVLPTISTEKADFQSFQDIGSKATDRTLVKVHGVLMTVAWMFCATLGIFMARFYKPVWSKEGQECCGQKRWFVVHRICMVSAFLLTATAFVIIFVHVEGFSEIAGSGFHKSHPIIGIVVMALALINPIMATFRCHPNTPKRPIFNVAHYSVGTLAHVGALINLFSGTALTAASLPSAVRIVLWVFVGWIVFIDICCHVYQCLQKKEESRIVTKPTIDDDNTAPGEAYELREVAGGGGASKSGGSPHAFKIYLLIPHILALMALTLAVVILISMSSKGHNHDEH